MKEQELRLFAQCSLCGKLIGHTGLPLFTKITVERIGILAAPVRRQTGLALLLGSAPLAMQMGQDEEMTHSLGSVTLSVCESCYVVPVMPARLAELDDVAAIK